MEINIIPLPFDSRHRQSLDGVFDQIDPDALNISLKIRVPNDCFDIEEEFPPIIFEHFFVEAVDSIVLKVPLVGREIIQHVHKPVNLFVHLEQSAEQKMKHNSEKSSSE